MFSTPLPFYIPPLSNKSQEFPDEVRFLNSLAIKTSDKEFQELKSDGKFQEFLPSEDLKCRNPECLSFYSSEFLSEKNNSDRWNCPFCGETNILNSFSLPKIPSNYTFTRKKEKNSWEKKLLFVFCLDFSGSMNCNYFRKGSEDVIREFIQAGQSFDFIETEFLVSRKEIVIESLHGFFNDLIKCSKDFDVRVFMILFNKQVQLLGDCSTNKIIYIWKEEELSSTDICFEFGKKYALELTSPFNEKVKNGLLLKLRQADAEFTTALGPAVAAGLGVVESFREQMGVRNAFTFVFTDGKSNIGVGSLDSENERKHSKIHYREMNKIALNSYLKFYFISFEDEPSALKTFSKYLFARTNGMIYQIKVANLNLGYKYYKSVNELELDKYMKNTVVNVFEGKIIQASIYHEYGCNMKLHHVSDVNREIKKYLITKKPTYSEGEPYIALYLESIDEKMVKQKKNICFQLIISFFSLNQENMIFFVSTFRIPLNKGNENPEEKFDEIFLNLIRRETKKKNIESTKEKCLAIVRDLKKQINYEEQKEKEEKKNEDISSDSDDESENNDKNTKNAHLKQAEKDSGSDNSDNSDGEGSKKQITRKANFDYEAKNKKKQSKNLEKEKPVSREINIDKKQERSSESSEDDEEDDHKTTIYHFTEKLNNQYWGNK